MARRFRIVIPARYGSSRLPGKPLVRIAGKPMLVHVCERALEAGAEQVVVAVDDERIAEALTGLPVQVLLTRSDHQSGTERLAEVIEQLEWPDQTTIVNVQGDEPLIRPELITALAVALTDDASVDAVTLATPIREMDEVFDPNCVKVVTDRERHAIYFSRAPIPWSREAFSATPQSFAPGGEYLRHIGLYAYRAAFIRRYVRWSRSPIEDIECLEQLRILWHGERMGVVITEDPPIAGVDTEADLKRIERLLSVETPA